MEFYGRSQPGSITFSTDFGTPAAAAQSADRAWDAKTAPPCPRLGQATTTSAATGADKT